MNTFTADLHIHTALSPCADDEMTPPRIVQAAVEQGLSMIAICDHNAAGNVAAAQAAGNGRVRVLAGMEITTAEEVHVLGLFPDADAAQDAAAALAETLPHVPSAAKCFGRQWLLDAEGHPIGESPLVLGGASSLSLSKAVSLIRSFKGLVVASHVDRPSYSITSQLGLFPDDVRFDAIEISAAGVENHRDSEFSYLGYTMTTSSDSHFLSEIGASRTFLTMEEPTHAELALAFQGIEGRMCCFA